MRFLRTPVTAGLALFAASMCSSPLWAAAFGGYITVNDPAHFVSKVFASSVEYAITADPTNRLEVTFDPSSSPFAIAETNNAASASFPYVGGITGIVNTNFNLGAGSYNYLYLGGTALTAPGATPAAGPNSFTSGSGSGIESSIWSISGSNVLTAQWVNSDASSVATQIVDLGGTIYLVGDKAAFDQEFGTNSTLDTLTFVCTSGACGTSNSTPEPSSLFLAAVGGFACLVKRRLR